MKQQPKVALRTQFQLSWRHLGLAGMAIISWSSVFFYLQEEGGEHLMQPVLCEATQSLSVSWNEIQVDWEQDAALVEWGTDFESGNDFFIIERSWNNTHFEPVGEVPGVGESQDSWTYQFIDDECDAARNPVAFYRIRQVDLDGAHSLSAVVSLLAPEQAAPLRLGSRR